MITKASLSLLAALALVATQIVPAFGQGQPVIPLLNGTPGGTASNPFNISGSFSASLGGFTPSASGARGTALTVTTSDSSGSLPSGAVVIVSNVGTNPMYCNVNAIAATVADQLVTSGGGWFAFTIPASVTTLHCIATGGSTTANSLGGSGLPTGTGGGSAGGGGGGGAVTIADGADVTQGAVADTACATDNGSCTIAALVKRNNQRLTTLNTTLGSPFQAGGSIGNTTFAATQATAASLNATVVGTGTFLVQAGQTGTWTVQPGNTANTTAWLVTGTGGTFPVTQATAGNLNATVVGTGTFAVQAAATLAAETTKVIGTVRNLGNAGAIFDGATGAAVPANAVQVGYSDGTNLVAGRVGAVANVAAATGFLNALGVAQYNATPLTVTDTRYQSLQADVNGFLKVNVAAGGASGGTSSSFAASFPATGTAVGMSQGGNMVALTGTSNNLNVQCANCSGSGVSAVDEAAFTAGTSVFAPGGGFFQTTATNNALTNGQQGAWQMTATRAGFVNLRNAAGTEVGTTGATLQVGAPSGAFASGSFASGSHASGSFASGAFASGSVASGAIASGAMVDLGAQADSVCGTATGTCSLIALTKFLNNAVNSSIPAGSALIGKVGIDQTTPGTTNGTAVVGVNAATALAGNGATGTGSLRVTIANDNTFPTGWGASTLASGSVASGAYASGSIASGALASGSIASGAMVDLGAQADTACATDNGTCTEIALTKRTNQRLTTIIAGIPVTNAGTFAVQLAANQSVNVAQINGVTPLMGNGVTGTGSQRVTIASDNTAFAVNSTLSAETTKVIGTVRNVGNVGGVFDAVVGAAPPANGIQTVALTSGATGGLVQPLIQCDQKAIYDASTNGSTELVALTSGRTIYICGKNILASGTVNVKLIYGTGTACATGSNNLTPAYQLTAQVGLVDQSPFFRGSKTASANALCINTSAGVAVQAEVYYAVL